MLLEMITSDELRGMKSSCASLWYLRLGRGMTIPSPTSRLEKAEIGIILCKKEYIGTYDRSMKITSSAPTVVQDIRRLALETRDAKNPPNANLFQPFHPIILSTGSSLCS